MNPIVPQLKDGPGWFRLPNSLVDKSLRRIKSRGVTLYVILARCSTRWHYPGVVDLAWSMGVSERKVEELLDVLLEEGLLNQSDLNAIRGVS